MFIWESKIGKVYKWKYAGRERLGGGLIVILALLSLVSGCEHLEDGHNDTGLDDKDGSFHRCIYYEDSALFIAQLMDWDECGQELIKSPKLKAGSKYILDKIRLDLVEGHTKVDNLLAAIDSYQTKTERTAICSSISYQHVYIKCVIFADINVSFLEKLWAIFSGFKSAETLTINGVYRISGLTTPKYTAPSAPLFKSTLSKMTFTRVHEDLIVFVLAKYRLLVPILIDLDQTVLHKTDTVNYLSRVEYRPYLKLAAGAKTRFLRIGAIQRDIAELMNYIKTDYLNKRRAHGIEISLKHLIIYLNLFRLANLIADENVLSTWITTDILHDVVVIEIYEPKLGLLTDGMTKLRHCVIEKDQLPQVLAISAAFKYTFYLSHRSLIELTRWCMLVFPRIEVFQIYSPLVWSHDEQQVQSAKFMLLNKKKRLASICLYNALPVSYNKFGGDPFDESASLNNHTLPCYNITQLGHNDVSHIKNAAFVLDNGLFLRLHQLLGDRKALRILKKSDPYGIMANLAQMKERQRVLRPEMSVVKPIAAIAICNACGTGFDVFPSQKNPETVPLLFLKCQHAICHGCLDPLGFESCAFCSTHFTTAAGKLALPVYRLQYQPQNNPQELNDSEAKTALVKSIYAKLIDLDELHQQVHRQYQKIQKTDKFTTIQCSLEKEQLASNPQNQVMAQAMLTQYHQDLISFPELVKLLEKRKPVTSDRLSIWRKLSCLETRRQHHPRI
ncbi:hypothetical protein NEHOM01_1025 [Nematocida homosporus]|uniref:uncharacterized protein n=1 Tax=Nematocida homosporus TaxID=1912981 RepID=UPI00221ED409|nr:uncharacterized protein NEHOM01_1025 [Nematocida homosporus]KAI5185733.1 hypothetical protein NEHOM01_1025 [Nematocida homosporus]